MSMASAPAARTAATARKIARARTRANGRLGRRCRNGRAHTEGGAMLPCNPDLVPAPLLSDTRTLSDWLAAPEVLCHLAKQLDLKLEFLGFGPRFGLTPPKISALGLRPLGRRGKAACSRGAIHFIVVYVPIPYVQ